MGSAAPSHRRWIVVLVLATGALLVALVPILDRSDPPTGGRAAGTNADPSDDGPGETGITEVGGRSAQVVTVALDLEDGWVVPEVDAEAAHQHTDSGDGELIVSALPVGSDTVGAAVDIRRGSESFVVRSSTPRDLAFRAGTEGRWGPWLPSPSATTKHPMGTRGTRGARPAHQPPSPS